MPPKVDRNDRTKRPNPCESCRTNSRKCDLERPKCGRCVKIGGLCRYLDVSPRNGNQCARCKKHKKKCDQSQPSCGRCFRANATCEYLEEHDDAFLEMDPLLAAKIATVAETSLLTLDAPKDLPLGELPLADQDLLPTFQDFLLATRYITEGKMSPEVACDLDLGYFLTNFFIEHPALRAVLLAHAAQSFRSEISDWAVLSYYRRARKAVGQYLNRPSLRTCQALCFLCQIADSTGQTDFSDIVFKQTVEMLLRLRLTEDPDSPYWVVQNLPDWQKEEMRCIFWRCAYWIKLRRTFGQTDMPAIFDFDLTTVRLPQRLAQSPFKVMTANADFVVKTRNYHTRIPISIRDMIVSQELLALNETLMQLLSEIPAHMMLVPQHNIPLTQKLQIFFKQMLQFNEVAQFAVISLTLGYYTSLALLHRPRVYLLAFLHADSFYKTSNQYAAELESSLRVATQAAQHMAHVFAFILLATRDYTLETSLGDPMQLPRIFNPSMWTWGFAVPAMEAAVILWFVLVRVPLSWRARVEFDAGSARTGLLVIREFLYLLEANLQGGSLATPYSTPTGDLNRNDVPTVISPIVKCVQAMLAQVFELQKQGEEAGGLEISMTVLNVTEDGDLAPVKTGAPFAVMGLLGVDVGGVTWKAAYEEDWRQWWVNVNTLPS